MTKFVTTSPQAQTYWGSVEIIRAELEPELAPLWEERKFRFRLQNRPGFRPGKAPLPKREQAEEEHLFDLYADKWGEHFVRGIEDYLRRKHQLLDQEVPACLYRVCHVDELTAVRRGDRYLISGIYFLWPSVDPKSDFSTRMLELSKHTLSEGELVKHLQARRIQQELDPVRVKRESTGEIKLGDFLEVEMATDIQQDYGQPPQTVLVEVNDDLQYDVREALVGRQVGEVVIMPWKMNPDTPDERHLKRILKVKTRLVPQSLSDEEFFALEGVSSWVELREKAQREYASHRRATIQTRLEELLLDRFNFGPVPGAWAVDRAEGFYNSLLQNHKTEGHLIKALGTKDRQTAIQALLPKCRRTILSHLASAYICATSLPRTFPPAELAGDIRLAIWQTALYMELEYFRLEVLKSVTGDSK